jgi:hypothetical protein
MFGSRSHRNADITERLGIRITSMTLAMPLVGIYRDLLAQADQRTATMYYNRAKGIEPSRTHNLGAAGTVHRPEYYGSYGFLGIKQTNSNSVHGDCVVGQMKKTQLIFSL